MQTATQRENGSSLGLSEIKGHNIYCGTATGVYGDAKFIAVLNYLIPLLIQFQASCSAQTIA